LDRAVLTPINRKIVGLGGLDDLGEPRPSKPNVFQDSREKCVARLEGVNLWLRGWTPDPPSGAFPIASLFLLICMFASFYTLVLAGVFSPFLASLAFGTLFSMFVFALFGRFFQAHGGIGQLAFVGLGLVFVIFSDQITSAFNLHLSLVQLSWMPPQVALTVNGSDMTWLLWVALAVTLYLTRHDLENWIRKVL
jgi:hypothetical protein